MVFKEITKQTINICEIMKPKVNLLTECQYILSKDKLCKNLFSNFKFIVLVLNVDFNIFHFIFFDIIQLLIYLLVMFAHHFTF